MSVRVQPLQSLTASFVKAAEVLSLLTRPPLQTAVLRDLKLHSPCPSSSNAVCAILLFCPIHSMALAAAVTADTHPDEPVPGLKVHCLAGVVDESESSRSTTTELGLHTEYDDLLLVCLVEAGELLGELSPGNVWPRWVNDIEDKLPSLQKAVGDELAGAQGDGGGGVL